METGGDRSERSDTASGGSGISRRHFLAGGLLSIGGGSIFVEGNTSATFTDSVSGEGEIRVDGEPSLDYYIAENNHSGNSNHVQFDIQYQVEWVSGFSSLDIYVDNNVDEEYSPGAGGSEAFTGLGEEGVVSTETFYGEGGTEFEFIFDISSSADDSFTRRITFTSGNGSSAGDQDDFQSPNDPVLDSFTVNDNWNNQGGNYVVEYFVSNTADFQGTVRVRFEAQNWNSPDGSYTENGSNLSNDSVTYGPGGGKNRTWNIFVEVVSENGVVLDSGEVEDIPKDNQNSTWSE